MPIVHSPINQDQKQHEQLGVAFAEQANTQVAALLFIKQQDTGGHGNAERQPHCKNDGEKLTYDRSVANLKISKQTAVRASEAAMLAIHGVASDFFSRKAINAKRPVAIASLISPILLSDNFLVFGSAVCWPGGV